MSLRIGVLHGMLEKEHRQEGFHKKNLFCMGFQRLSGKERASNDDMGCHRENKMKRERERKLFVGYQNPAG